MALNHRTWLNLPKINWTSALIKRAPRTGVTGGWNMLVSGVCRDMRRVWPLGVVGALGLQLNGFNLPNRPFQGSKSLLLQEHGRLKLGIVKKYTGFILA